MNKDTAALRAPIGVLDSGVGGLSVLKCLHRLLPGEDFLYVGDTARTPYGTRSEAEIRGFVEEILCWLEARGAKQVVIACNTLTMLGVDTLQRQHAFGIIGMSKGEQLLLAASRKKRIGVFATPFTISTEAHKKALLAADPGVRVFPVPCPKFVPLIEGERFGGAELAAAVKEYTDIVKAADVDALILSCTHYPFVREEIEAALGSGVTVIDPAEATALLSREALAQAGLLRPEAAGGRAVIGCTADLERVKRLAARMLLPEDCSFELVTLLSK